VLAAELLIFIDVNRLRRGRLPVVDERSGQISPGLSLCREGRKSDERECQGDCLVHEI
jgi:hypothetical protein